MKTEELVARLQAVEDREAIRELKATDFAACDGKDPAIMRACFRAGPVAIDYGALDNADDLVQVFRDIGSHPHLVEMHHGLNPRIRITGPDSAEGE